MLSPPQRFTHDPGRQTTEASPQGVGRGRARWVLAVSLAVSSALVALGAGLNAYEARQLGDLLRAVGFAITAVSFAITAVGFAVMACRSGRSAPALDPRQEHGALSSRRDRVRARVGARSRTPPRGAG